MLLPPLWHWIASILMLMIFSQTSSSDPMHPPLGHSLDNAMPPPMDERYLDPKPHTFHPSDTTVHGFGDGLVDTTVIKRGIGPGQGFRIIQHHPQSAIIPTVSSLTALKGFWQLISMKALYNNAFHEPTKELFTMTEGVLQATFSSLGHEIPWLFVQDFAMKIVGLTERGWTNTFDMVYEQEGTGFVFWISLRVLVKARPKGSAGKG